MFNIFKFKKLLGKMEPTLDCESRFLNFSPAAYEQVNFLGFITNLQIRNL